MRDSNRRAARGRLVEPQRHPVALGHPVRLLLLRQVLSGAGTVAELQERVELGTSGQLYHHLRQLVGARWLQVAARGRYAVPPERVVPLLVVLAAARREPA